MEQSAGPLAWLAPRLPRTKAKQDISAPLSHSQATARSWPPSRESNHEQADAEEAQQSGAENKSERQQDPLSRSMTVWLRATTLLLAAAALGSTSSLPARSACKAALYCPAHRMLPETAQSFPLASAIPVLEPSTYPPRKKSTLWLASTSTTWQAIGMAWLMVHARDWVDVQREGQTALDLAVAKQLLYLQLRSLCSEDKDCGQMNGQMDEQGFKQ
ncbi:hypothetical protein BDZ91DRAFT_808448 [Kalaharituber pfeilii]|nr:hypothetical protein BDZ91DRAFT_808448 [Kalaharituber pfeilii]